MSESLKPTICDWGSSAVVPELYRIRTISRKTHQAHINPTLISARRPTRILLIALHPRGISATPVRTPLPPTTTAALGLDCRPNFEMPVARGDESTLAQACALRVLGTNQRGQALGGALRRTWRVGVDSA